MDTIEIEELVLYSDAEDSSIKAILHQFLTLL
jgi:hypothetical protein